MKWHEFLVLFLLLCLLRSCMPIDITVTHKIYERPKPIKWEWFDNMNEKVRVFLQGE